VGNEEICKGLGREGGFLFWGVMVFVVLCVVLIYEKLLSGDSGVPGESASKEILVKMVVRNFRDQ